MVVGELLDKLGRRPDIDIELVPIVPKLPRVLAPLQSVRYLRTVVNSCGYLASLLLRLFRCDVVHVLSASYWSFILATAPAILIGRLYGRRVLLNYHSGEAADHLANWRSGLPVVRKADRVVVPSAYLRGVFDDFGIEAGVVANFVDLEAMRMRAPAETGYRFLANRTFEAHYNVADVLRAFARIQQQLPAAELTVAGDGPLRDDVHRLAGDLGLRAVRFVGSVSMPRMIELYADADVYLNASLIDNMPMSLLEAAACGVVIVSSDAGGIPHMLRAGHEALLVPAGDDAALADAALSLYDGRADAAELTRNARALVERDYAPGAVVDGWVQEYRHLAEGRR